MGVCSGYGNIGSGFGTGLLACTVNLRYRE